MEGAENLVFTLAKRVWLKRYSEPDRDCKWELPVGTDKYKIFKAAELFTDTINHRVRMGLLPFDYRADVFYNSVHFASMMDMRGMGLSTDDLREYHNSLDRYGDPMSVQYIRQARLKQFFQNAEKAELYSSAGPERRFNIIKELL